MYVRFELTADVVRTCDRLISRNVDSHTRVWSELTNKSERNDLLYL